MNELIDQPETPATFLANVAERLAAKTGVDKELAAILGTHILIADPTDQTVPNAKAAITALATVRAKTAVVSDHG